MKRAGGVDQFTFTPSTKTAQTLTRAISQCFVFARRCAKLGSQYREGPANSHHSQQKFLTESLRTVAVGERGSSRRLVRLRSHTVLTIPSAKTKLCWNTEKPCYETLLLKEYEKPLTRASANTIEEKIK